MKTDNEVTRAVTEKIEKLEAKRVRVRKRIKQISVGAIMIGFLLPATVHFVTMEEFSQPAQYAPPTSEAPFDADLTPKDSTEIFYEEETVIDF